MISRYALLVWAILMAVMVAATAWRLALLPDWSHIPWPTADVLRERSSFYLFIGPSCAAIVGGQMILRRWITTGASPEAAMRWSKWGSPVVVVYTVICALMQGLFLTRSFGIELVHDKMLFSRIVFALLGALMAFSANQLPKLPWLQPRLRILQLDPAQGAKLVRLTSRLLVLLGLIIVVAAILLPLRLMAPLVFSMVLTLLAVNLVRRIQLRREQHRSF